VCVKFSKPSGGFDCLARALGRNVGTGTGLVIGNRFETVGAAEKGAELTIDARVVLDEPAKLALPPALRL
jgi:hypothetical protein